MNKIVASLALVGVMASGAFAMGGNCQMGMQNQGQQQGMHGGGMMMGMPMLQKINLTDDQRHKLAVLNSEMKLEMTKLQDSKMPTKMQELMVADTFDKKEFIKMHNEMHEKMIAIKANHMEKVFNLLTKEQRAELKNMGTKQAPAKM